MCALVGLCIYNNNILWDEHFFFSSLFITGCACVYPLTTKSVSIHVDLGCVLLCVYLCVCDVFLISYYFFIPPPPPPCYKQED